MKRCKPYFKIITQLPVYCFLFFISKAQWYNPEKVNKKARDLYVPAFEDASNGKFEESLQKLEAVLKAEPAYVEAYLTRANVYAELRDYPASVKDFDKAMQLDSVFSSTYLLPYSISLAGNGEFNRALTAVNKFLATPGLNQRSIKSGSYRKSTYEFAVAYAAKHPAGNYNFAAVNLGDNINSEWHEYFPSLTIDGKKMIFTRREKNEDEDFYESNLVDGKWSKSMPVGGKINTNFNEGAQNISQDGEWLIFTGCGYPEGLGNCDLYIAYKTKNGNWTEPENLGPVVNTENRETSPSLSPDKKDLYFSSDRPGGYGATDIWVSHRNSSGKWGRPQNLGPAVNTSAEEGCPFIHADNQTLYFNSNGHMGYGYTDLFLSRKLSDSTWGEPENLGYPINTIEDEGSLIVASDGKTSYYASTRGENNRGGFDIYTFQLRDDIKAARTLWVKGRVYDKKTNAGLPSSVELTDINSRRTVSKLQTDENGNYLVTLPEGKDYAFNVNRRGYLFYSDNFSLEKDAVDSFFNIDIPLQPIEAGASIVLKNIFFDTKKYDLKPSSLSELDKVILLMSDNPKLKIQISGHTDNVGNNSDNLALSLNRAKAVTIYLTSKGILAARLTFKGYGDTKPVSSNETDEGKALNRRTELNVISN